MSGLAHVFAQAPSPMRFLRLMGRMAAATAAAGAALAGATEAAAPDTASRWRLNGYGTLGVVHVDASPAGWGFTRDMSQPAQSGTLRAGIDSRLGLQVNWQATTAVEFVAQGVLRRQAPDAAASQRLDWAFAAWRPDADWTLRLGRTSPDVFLLADYRNVGFAFPWVRPNVEMYGFIAFQSLDGADLARRWQAGGADWKAKLSMGRNTTTQPNARTGADGQALPGVELKSKDLVIATLSREQGGLTVKATYARTREQVDTTQQLAPLLGGLRQLAAAGVPGVSAEAATLASAVDLSGFRARYVAFGAELERAGWHLMVELSRTAGDAHDTNGLRGYVSAAYRLGSVTPFVMLGRAKPERGPFAVPQHWAAALAPALGADAAAAAVQLGGAAAAIANTSRYGQRSLSLGARWDLGPQTALKLQADRYRVAPGASGAWPGSNGFDGGRADLVSATVDFVF